MRRSQVPLLSLHGKKACKENAAPPPATAGPSASVSSDAVAAPAAPSFASAAKPLKPFVPTQVHAHSAGATRAPSEDAKRYYTCMYTSDPATKKRKSWEDGILVCSSNSSWVLTMEGKEVARQLGRPPALSEGQTWRVGRKDCEVLATLPEDQFLSGALFLGSAGGQAPALAPKVEAPRSAPFKPPAARGAGPTPAVPSRVPPWRHDPDAANALVLNGRSEPFTVVVDPVLASHLRPHQREGVQFMYDCVMGRGRPEGPAGCILADEMGLGKTLQTIALIWTLVKQGPSQGGAPVARKAVVVTPSSLVGNWAKEVSRWLGPHRLDPIVAATGSGVEIESVLREFTVANHRPLLIISYENYKKHRERINSIKTIGLAVCDEGHRLKNAAGNDTTAALAGVPTPRRVILSGTPVQNDLKEFYAMISWCSPAALGSLPCFMNQFANAIERGRDKNASDEEKRLGEERAAQLGRTTARLVLRRTAALLRRFLPPRSEHTVFCRLSPLQERLYRHFLASHSAAKTVTEALPLILALRKLCNSPRLVHASTPAAADDEEGGAEGAASAFADAADIFDEEKYDPSAGHQPRISGKMDVLEAILAQCKALGERIVVVSHFTQTLDVIQAALAAAGYTYCRLDGGTVCSKRQPMVDRFNSPYGDFAFLLSSKAGGVGLNLIGASRLVLFDPDWNPAHDLQAMARVWRDGQQRPVHVYRLLAAGSIDERIFQRQIKKMELSDTVVDERKALRQLAQEDIRGLFSLHCEARPCHTAELLRGSNAEWAEDEGWEGRLSDGLLQAACGALRDGPGGVRVAFVHSRSGGATLAAGEGEAQDVGAEGAEGANAGPASPQRRRRRLRGGVRSDDVDELEADC